MLLAQKIPFLLIDFKAACQSYSSFYCKFQKSIYIKSKKVECTIIEAKEYKILRIIY
jgi:hypothetical protein